MKEYNLYRILPKEKTLKAIKEIDFSDHDFKERYDIQEWVESNPDILGEKLLLIGKELSYFTDTRERLDLLALDTKGNIVIVELKRDDSGIGMDWQAIKYASYMSKFTSNDILTIYHKYLLKNVTNDDEIDLEQAEQNILDFIEEDNIADINKRQRIILVSHRFAKEITSAVHWMIDKYSMDIKCLQLIPFYDRDKDAHYVQANIILPVAGIDDLIIKASGEKEKTRTTLFGPVRNDDEITKFFVKISQDLYSRLEIDLAPTKKSRWAGRTNWFRYYHFWYKDAPWDNWSMSYKIDRYSEANRHNINSNSLRIFFDVNTQYLINKGVDESTIKILSTFLETVQIDDFKFKVGNNILCLEAFIKSESLDDTVRTDLADKLSTLIEATQSEINKILDV